MEEADTLDRAGEHLAGRDDRKIAISIESEKRNDACCITKSILVVDHVRQGGNWLPVLLVNMIRSAVSAAEDQVVVRGVDNVRVACRHHERAGKATLRCGVAKVGAEGASRTGFYHREGIIIYRRC